MVSFLQRVFRRTGYGPGAAKPEPDGISGLRGLHPAKDYLATLDTGGGSHLGREITFLFRQTFTQHELGETSNGHVFSD